MAKCHTCGNVADTQSATCTRCGRPNPTVMRKSEVIGSIIGAAIIGVILLVANFDGDTRDESTETDPAFEANPIAYVEPSMSSSPVEEPASSGRNAEPSARYIATSGGPGDAEQSKPVANESIQLSASAVDQGAFPYPARLVDGNGKVVIQSGPSIFSANVETLPAGDTVHAASRSDKWVSVQIRDGRTGFVKLRQLEFQ